MRNFTLPLLLALTANVTHAATLYTGDVLNGVPVISQLDVADLDPGKVHRFMFQGASNGLAQHWYVPVMVAKGGQPGGKLGLQAAVHGDELNGIRVIQQVFADLDLTKLKGSVVGVIGANPSGMMSNNRNWQLTDDGGSTLDFNRIWPGKEEGNTAEQQAWRLWNKVWSGNVDRFVDMHTQSTGTEFPLFIYADYSKQNIKELAELFPADQIKADPGEKGSVETTFVEHGIPAITLEIGKPKAYQPDLIARGVMGIHNVMVKYEMLPGNLGTTSKEQQTYVGNQITSIRAQEGGFADVLVKIGDEVTKGQKVAIQRNAFGDIIKEYQATESGKVLSVGTDPMREARALLVRILWQDPDPKCQNGC